MDLKCGYEVSERNIPALMDYLSGGGAGWRLEYASEISQRPTGGRRGIRVLSVTVRIEQFDQTFSCLIAGLTGMLRFIGPEVRLVMLEPADCRWFEAISDRPRGVRRIYEVLGLAKPRPVIVGVLKPGCLDPSDAADLAREFVDAGCDIVKDDELAGDGAMAIERLGKVASKLETHCQRHGQRCIYVIRGTGPAALAAVVERQADHRAIHLGVMVAPHVDGFDALLEARRMSDGHVVFSHPAAAPAHMALGVGVSVLPRLAGADAVVSPSPFGLLSVSVEEGDAICAGARQPMGAIPQCLVVFGGGVDAKVARRIAARFGAEVGVAIGASALRNRPMMHQRLLELQRVFREASD